MGDWTGTKLGNVIDVIMGQSPSGETYNDMRIGLPLIQGAADLGVYTPKPHRFTSAPTKVSLAGDTLISVRAPVGLANWVDGQYCLGRGVAALRAREGISEEFLYYLTHSMNEHWQQQATGTTFPGISGDTIRNTPIVIPPLHEQREIAIVLGALDDKIELDRRMNTTLEALARALFQSWFVDFDPVRAKAEGRQPVGMDAETAALFSDKFEDSVLGPIPQGWEIATVGSVTACVGGTTPSTAAEGFWESGTHHWATPKDLARLKTTFLTKTERMITKAGLSQISSGELPLGTVLLSSRAPIGYLSITAIPTSINQGFIAIICNGALTSYYMLNWCRENMSKIESRASGTTFQEINKRNFKSLEVLVPNPAVIKQHSEIMDRVYAKILSNTLEIERLIELRESLLPKLLSGELRAGAAAA